MAKRKKKAQIRCLSCDSKLKPRDVACRKCGRMRPGSFQSRAATKSVFAPVGAPAFVAKSAVPRCPRCNSAARAGQRHCTRCGASMLTVVKSAEDVRRDALMARFRREDNPDFAEATWYAAHPEIDRGANGGQAS